MKSIIVGGGKLGFNLLKILRQRGYDATLIELDEGKCRRIAEETGADVICGDGTELEVLNDAGIIEADIIAAVTGKDENNLVVCEIAQSIFHIKSIARINNPKNTDMFRKLGVERTVCSTQVIANLIEYEFEGGNCRFIQAFDRGNMILVEISPVSNNGFEEHLVKDLDLPAECTVASIIRNNEVIYPKADTVIKKDDCIYLVTNHANYLAIRKNLHKGGRFNEKHKK
ncbi:MAG TPA: NAD-binding protein [Clostridiales bacterium]|nr:MAG: Trk system potassium uptake protein TrkA [Firmicutes bacterium ADurb.Bin262]HOU11353.1 NAD-binding protein [Clostridiales bacterium]HQH63342.1 NAD-binding protein [Clostridiales bacterium]HQK74501.1 NAD-binding protein [Clostridiales bacterium]